MYPQIRKMGYRGRLTSKIKRRAFSVDALLYSAYLASTLFFITIVILVSNLPSPDIKQHFINDHHQLSDAGINNYDQSNSVHVDRRIAIVIPYISPPDDYLLPVTFSIFLRTVHASASLIDFLIPHNGELTPLIDEHASTIQGMSIPSNVKFIDLMNIQSMARLFLRVVDSSLRNKKLLNTIVHFFQSYPYALVEFKPALGHIFKDYLPEETYSHWGYSDFDIAFGDLPRWITMDELEQYDIVTYGYGDQNRVYLRGQFTFHRNSEKINNLWRGCTHLSKMDERFQKVASGRKLQFESAEGCYSHVVLQSNDLRVKFAVKAFTDHSDKDVHEDENSTYSNGVIVGIGENGDKSIIYKAGRSKSEDTNFLQLSKTWFKEGVTNPKDDHEYNNTSQPLQWEVGQMTQVYTFGEEYSNNVRCSMYWIRREYQPDLCVRNVDKTDTVFLIDGALFKQKYKRMTFPANVDSLSFFHLQEWKKSYRPSQLVPFQYNSDIDSTSIKGGILGWMILPEGGIPLLPPSYYSDKLDVPAHTSQRVDAWEKTSSLLVQQLPRASFCLHASKKPHHLSTKCDTQLSWHNENINIISNNENLWSGINLRNEITLALTLQITEEQNHNIDTLHRLLDVLESNLTRWGDHPVVLLIHVAVANDWICNEIERRFGAATIRNLPHLTGIISSKQTSAVSRKALLNMAESACRTRWVMSGLEVERGMILSDESYFFAKRTATIHKNVAGNIYVVPHFAVSKKHAEISHIRKELKIKYDYSINILAKVIERSYMQQTDVLTDADLKKLHHVDESPILMLDMLGPRDGMITSNLALEVDEFGGSRCMNMLRLAQLSILGYRILPISGVYAISTSQTRLVSCLNATENKQRSSSRCKGSCMLTDERLIKKIANEEIMRVMKTSLLWQDWTSS